MQQISSNQVEQPLIPRLPGLSRPLSVGLWAVLLLLLGSLAFAWPLQTALALCGLSVGIPALWLLWQRPEFGLISLLGLTAVAFTNISLPIGLGLHDLLLIVIVGVVALRALVQRRIVLPRSLLTGPLVLFLAIALFSTVYAITLRGVGRNPSLNELRPQVMLATFIATALGIRSRRQLVGLMVGLFLLADIVALLVIVIEVLGPSSSFVQGALGQNWRVWWIAGASGFGSIRVMPSGQFLVYSVSILAFLLMFQRTFGPRLRFLMLAQWLLLNYSLLFSYTRTQWVASAVAIIAVLVLLPKADRSQLFKQLVLWGGAGLILALLFGAALQQLGSLAFADAIGNRFSTLLSPDDTIGSNSVQWRVFENSEATDAILKQPLLGVGLGNTYRTASIDHRQSLGANDSYYGFVHNSFLYLGVKLGLPGLLAFVWFYGATLWLCWRTRQRMATAWWGATVMAIMVACATATIWMTTFPLLFEKGATSTIGMLAGIVVVMHGLSATTQVSTQQESILA